MSVATDNNTATTAAAGAQRTAAGHDEEAAAVERALTAAIEDAAMIGELLATLRTARLWLPLPDSDSPVTASGAVILPTVTYLGNEFVPAYTSGELLASLATPHDPAAGDAPIPHLVVRAADLAKLLPPHIGIALNPGAHESVPIYPQGVAYLAAEDSSGDGGRISVGPLPAEPRGLFAGIRSGLSGIPQASQAVAAWLSVQFSGDGIIISVTLDDPADALAKEAVISVLERVAQETPEDGDYPIDVTFPGEGEPDYIDHWVAAFGTPFYQRA